MNFSSQMLGLMNDVRNFQDMCGSVSPAEPVTNPEPNLIRLRAKLIFEECFETLLGMFDSPFTRETAKEELNEIFAEMDKAQTRFDIEAIADGLADLIYVCVGAALAFGIPLDRVWAEVQRANMDKLGGGRRADGKILKPEGWVPPNIKEAIFGGAE